MATVRMKKAGALPAFFTGAAAGWEIQLRREAPWAGRCCPIGIVPLTIIVLSTGQS